MFVNGKTGEVIDIKDNPKMVYDVYTDEGWFKGDIEYVSLYTYLNNTSPLLEVSKRIWNESRRHGIQVKRDIVGEHDKAPPNRYPKPWLDMIFDVIIYPSEKENSNLI